MKETVAIKMEKELIQKIDELREGTERSRSAQIRLMLKKYVELLEK